MTEPPRELRPVQTAASNDTRQSDELDVRFEFLLERRHTKTRISLGIPGCSAVRWVDLERIEDGVIVCYVLPPGESIGAYAGPLEERATQALTGRFPAEKVGFAPLGFPRPFSTDCEFAHDLLLQALLGPDIDYGYPTAKTTVAEEHFHDRLRGKADVTEPAVEDRLAYTERLFVELHEQVCPRCRDIRLGLELASGAQFLTAESR